MLRRLIVLVALGLVVPACGDDGPTRPLPVSAEGAVVEVAIHAPATMVVTYGPAAAPLRPPVTAKARANDAKTVQDALLVVRTELAAIVAQRRVARFDRRLELVVSGDADVPWHWALGLMRAASHESVGVARMTFAVRDNDSSATVPVVDHAALSTPAPDGVIEVRVQRQLQAVPNGAITQVLVGGAKQGITFGVDAAEATRALSELLVGLQADGPKGVVVVTAADDGWSVPFPDVIRVIAASLAAGCPEVRLSEAPRNPTDPRR